MIASSPWLQSALNFFMNGNVKYDKCKFYSTTSWRRMRAIYRKQMLFSVELWPVLPFACVSLTVCQMRGGQFPGATATTVCTVEPDICTFSAWYLLYVILLAPKKADEVPTLVKIFVNPWIKYLCICPRLQDYSYLFVHCRTVFVYTQVLHDIFCTSLLT
jgi:hypothetical protein